MQSNGWDDATTALQLLSHLEGDALNVALLVPESRRASQVGLVGVLTEHYGSPGRLADYRWNCRPCWVLPTLLGIAQGIADLAGYCPGGQLPRVGTQFEPDPYADVGARKFDLDSRGRPQADLVPSYTVGPG